MTVEGGEEETSRDNVVFDDRIEGEREAWEILIG